jgi:hypothetical protein
VQKFHWKDLTAKRGGLYQYRIIPVVGAPGDLKPAPAPVWETNPVHVTPDRGDAFTFFNRGILSTQSLARQLPAGSDVGMFKVLRDRIDQPGDPPPEGPHRPAPGGRVRPPGPGGHDRRALLLRPVRVD